MIWVIVGRLLAALVKPLTYLFGALWLRNDAVKDARARDYVKTREKMDAVEDLGNDPDAARRWLHERGQQRDL